MHSTATFVIPRLSTKKKGRLNASPYVSWLVLLDVFVSALDTHEVLRKHQSMEHYLGIP